jgi:predicted GTPase
MGYSPQQVRDLEATINAADCDLVLSATPIDLAGLVTIKKPMLRVRYEYADHGDPTLESIIRERLAE